MSLNFTSIYGRWLGVTYGSSVGASGAGQNKYLSGDVEGLKMKNIWFGDLGSEIAENGRDALQTLTSGTTATLITAGGVTTIATSSALTWNLASPYPTVQKFIQTNTTGTPVTVTVRISTAISGNFQTTAGSSFQAVTLTVNGAGIWLEGLSTSIWQVLSVTSTSTTGGNPFTT